MAYFSDHDMGLSESKRIHQPFCAPLNEIRASCLASKTSGIAKAPPLPEVLHFQKCLDDFNIKQGVFDQFMRDEATLNFVRVYKTSDARHSSLHKELFKQLEILYNEYDHPDTKAERKVEISKQVPVTEEDTKKLENIHEKDRLLLLQFRTNPPMTVSQLQAKLKDFKSSARLVLHDLERSEEKRAIVQKCIDLLDNLRMSI